MKDKVKQHHMVGPLRSPMGNSELFGKATQLPPIGANTNISKSAPRSAPIRSPLNAGTGLFKSRKG